MLKVDPNLLKKLHRPVPRYTSYPTAPTWEENFPQATYNSLLENAHDPLSIYIHIPFCKTMCLFCGCSVVLNRKPDNEETYVRYICQEIELTASLFRSKKTVSQLHFGGGTPTKLKKKLLAKIMATLDQNFTLDYSQEIAIEIDPRTVMDEHGDKLKFLKELGFNRISFGVQDTDPRVQEAIKRRQSEAMTRQAYELARKLGFSKINIDLIYGLPYQTPKSFEQTLRTICELRPDRIAFFSYARTPWLKPHQNAIPENTLPTLEEKFTIYVEAREKLIGKGYCAIGMDHFAWKDDELARSYHEKTLHRNFQGYSVRLSEEMIGFGITSIGFIGQTYVQNQKTLTQYYAALNRKELPCFRGKMLTADDKIRRWVILKLMCHFHLDKRAFLETFEVPFDSYFSRELEQLRLLEADGLMHDQPDCIIITSLGELFIRLVAAAFDAYSLPSSQPLHSQSI